MLKDQIEVGRLYVHEESYIAREVVEEMDHHHVKTNTFDLATGKLVPTRHKIWRRSQLARWADREARPSETALVHPYETAAWFDILFPPKQAGIPLEEAKIALDGNPGRHKFPIGK